MNRLILVVLASSAGCAVQAPADVKNCDVFDFNGDLTHALIYPTPEMRKVFLAKLDTQYQNGSYCWYQTKAGQIELFDGAFGHVFVRERAAWEYRETLVYSIRKREPH